ncbi:hypothetical protein AB9F34_33960, partial [Rhizobium leguminosarum]
LLFIVLEPIYTFVAATWVAKNIYIQLGMSIVTGLITVAAIIARIFFQQKISGDLNGRASTMRRKLQARFSTSRQLWTSMGWAPG